MAFVYQDGSRNDVTTEDYQSLLKICVLVAKPATGSITEEKVGIYKRKFSSFFRVIFGLRVHSQENWVSYFSLAL